MAILWSPLRTELLIENSTKLSWPLGSTMLTGLFAA
jgi:hypothetical protein